MHWSQHTFVVQMEPPDLDIDGLIPIGPLLRALDHLLSLPRADSNNNGHDCLTKLADNISNWSIPTRKASQKFLIMSILAHTLRLHANNTNSRLDLLQPARVTEPNNSEQHALSLSGWKRESARQRHHQEELQQQLQLQHEQSQLRQEQIQQQYGEQQRAWTKRVREQLHNDADDCMELLEIRMQKMIDDNEEMRTRSLARLFEEEKQIKAELADKLKKHKKTY